ncbi:uncharacterized protein LOC123297915 [Chrysoperla carnea]|uniref:uncharacterized protein LOC123297915 n=1 Tax=Chrysoperla carnea TaxID=189513 RepID=UPI001D095C99|nr:uncharacterized protein LOC123297915 [Chrysoperla carnea]
MVPFRISVSLNSFFNDQRSLSYILIDSRFQTIEDLENHIKIVFKLKPDCDICLISNNHLLPSTEEINLIHEGDSLHVSPANKDFCLRTKSNVIHEEDLQPPIKKRKTSKKHLNTACISLDDSSDEKDVLKIEPETAPQPAKKKKKKKSVQFGETFQNDTHKTESNETVVMEVDSIDQRNVIDNKNIQILNIENVSNMKLDSINRTNLESKIDENEILFCTTEVNNSNYYKNEASSSKNYDLKTNSKFTNTDYSASNFDNNDTTASQCFDLGTSSKFSNVECTTSKIDNDSNITSQRPDQETSSKFRDTGILKKNLSTSQHFDSETTPTLCNTGNNTSTLYKNSKFDIASTSKIICGINDTIKNDNTTNIDENTSVVKDGETSNEFIEHLRVSHNGSRGKIPPFTIGDFLNYAHSVGNKNETKIEDNNMNSPCAHVTKRRKRIRKRKSRSKDGNISINSMSDVEPEFRRPLIAASPRLHIRFDSLDKNSNETTLSATNSPICSSTPNPESTKCTVKKENNETILNKNDRNSIKENSITESKIEFSRNLANDSLDVNDNFFKNIDLTNNNLENVKNVLMKKDVPPEINDIIAFKMYELNEKYEPCISNWIVGKILKWYPTEKHVDVFILAGQIKTNVPNGKFELEGNGDCENEDNQRNESESLENGDDRRNNKSSIVNLNFTNLIDPRLIIIKN